MTVGPRQCSDCTIPAEIVQSEHYLGPAVITLLTDFPVAGFAALVSRTHASKPSAADPATAKVGEGSYAVHLSNSGFPAGKLPFERRTA